ncbi:hypothetical protein [Martelella alba]|uniref:Uncharacterized protein n=1 Tax=Martelella alba TaxID=2590451 RepID=A0ABY2SMI2_9HYPH|nr:hypothetical protein [Martelella alba]TKI06998.1 hypothetical protein FCN80_08625 [Martelella alba]
MSKFINHLGMVYNEIPIEDVLKLAHELIKQGKAWHSHAISPGCHFNPYPDRYAVMLEDNTDNIITISPSVTFPEVDKQLVKLLHGDDILGTEIPPDCEAVARASPLLSKVLVFERQGVRWHHHMNFPECLMTPHTTQWTMTVESEQGVLEEQYDEEPKDILKCLEMLYFRHQDSDKG